MPSSLKAKPHYRKFLMSELTHSCPACGQKYDEIERLTAQAIAEGRIVHKCTEHIAKLEVDQGAYEEHIAELEAVRDAALTYSDSRTHATSNSQVAQAYVKLVAAIQEVETDE